MDDPDTGRIRFVTHQRPHLDEVVCAWLLTTFDPAYANCSFEFIPYFGTPPVGDTVVTIGIGGGKYDEHKIMDRHTSATKLVFDDLVARGLIPAHGYELQAITWLVEYSDSVDRGQQHFDDEEHWPYTFPGIIRAHRQRTNDDVDTMRFGLELVGNLMTELNDKALFLKDWDKRIEFDSAWGKTVAVESDYYFSEVYAYSHGCNLRIQRHRAAPIATIKFNPQREGDLTPIFAKLNELEPTSWYLHQAKKMVISSIDPSTGREPTKLSLSQLIDVVKTSYAA